MGNALAPYIRGDGIKQGHQIVRRCEECDATYVGWSDDAMTIKGPMPIQLKCDVCAKKFDKDIFKDMEYKYKNQRDDKPFLR